MAGTWPFPRSRRADALPASVRMLASSLMMSMTSVSEILDEERAYRIAVVNAANRLAEEAGDRDLLDFARCDGFGREGNGVGENELAQRRIDDSLNRGPGEHGVGGAGHDAPGPVRMQRPRGVAQRARGV